MVWRALSFGMLGFLSAAIALTYVVQAIGWGRHDTLILLTSAVIGFYCGALSIWVMRRLKIWWEKTWPAKAS